MSALTPEQVERLAVALHDGLGQHTPVTRRPCPTCSGAASRLLAPVVAALIEEHNMATLSGADLRRACRAHQLPTSGTKRHLASLLLEAGLTTQHVRTNHSYTAHQLTKSDPS